MPRVGSFAFKIVGRMVPTVEFKVDYWAVSIENSSNRQATDGVIVNKQAKYADREEYSSHPLMI
jgi:hypothetical protein